MTASSPQGFHPLGNRVAVLANAVVLAVLATMAVLQARNPELYRMSLQEDEHLEWATFWAFLIAGGFAIVRALRQERQTRRTPWFLAGLAVFLVVVAMEEISWAQRIFDYRPPSYFLEHNFQQEPNFHNVVSTGLRKLALKSIIVGYGIALPLAGLLPWLGGWLRRIGIDIPPVGLIPSFAATYLLYQVYPWDYSGEIVELMLGLAFLFALVGRAPIREGATSWPFRRRELTVLYSALLVLALGLATAAAARFQSSARLENVELADTELEALKHDYLAMSDPERRRFATKCGLHKRLYSWEQKYKRTGLRSGAFAGLVQQGLPEERADYYIDPWNAPYWIRDRCSKDGSRRHIFVYSFGPNRRRDSSTWEVQGDDVGVTLWSTDGS